MINWQSILSSFDDKPTLLEWLKKVQKALNESALTTVTVTQEKVGKVNNITLAFNFQDGTKIVAPAFTVQDGKDAIIDPTKNLKCKSFTAEQISGSTTQSVKLNYDAYITVTNPAGTRQFFIPWNYGSGSFLLDKGVKTLLGKSIVGTGNIDLYQHNICFKSTDQDKLIKIRFIVISSKNVVVDSLADLKTLLGSTFTYPVNGATSDNKSVYEITDAGYKAGTTPYVLYDTVTPYPAGTWTDDVKTV